MGAPINQLALELGAGVAPIEPATIAALLKDGACLLPHAPEARGYVVTYRGGDTACPCCGRSNWLVGRLLAECAFCAAAIALPDRGTSSTPAIIGRSHRAPPPIVRNWHRPAALPIALA